MIHTYISPAGETVTWGTPDVHSPLDATGALATLLAVLEVVPVQDAANAVSLTADDLIAEAEAWAAASQ
jgi:hypothetical protein